jgi:hypothetical protein
MLQCPKCGFSQPKDQYCARCGVDITTFKRPEVPALQKFLKSTFFHLSLVALVIVAVAALLSYRNKDENSSRLNYFRGQFPMASEKNKPPQNSSDRSSDTSPLNNSVEGATEDYSLNKAKDLSGEDLTGSVAADGLDSSEAAAGLKADAGSSGAEADNESGTRNLLGAARASAVGNNDGNALATNTTRESNLSFKINYYEVNSRFLDLLVDDSKKTGLYNSYDGYDVGAVRTFHKKMATMPQQIPVVYSEVKKILPGRSAEWFLGLKSNNSENHIGFYQYIDAEWIGRNQVRVNFQVTKSWRESTGPAALVQKATYPMTIEIPKEGAFFIAGLLNNGPNGKNPYQNEDYIASLPPFGILKSNRFRRGETQLVLVIELEKN